MVEWQTRSSLLLLCTLFVQMLPPPLTYDESAGDGDPLAVAIVGRPNVGKL